MKKILIHFTICLIATVASGQKQGNIWYFGHGAGINFNSGSPVPISGGQIYPNPQNAGEYLHSEGSAVISDSSGQLLFYSNGENIWNKNHQIMPNGGNLMGMYSSTTAAFIVPQPLSDTIFYVFTTDGIERDLQNGLRYSIVDMCLDNGLGDVIPGQKNILLLDLACEKITAINHQNGKDIWLIAHKFNSDAFYAYQISEYGIIDTVITHIGSVHTGNGYYTGIGQMKSSPDGTRIALVFSNISPSVTELFNFDNSTGIVSNMISLGTGNSAYGVEFSPDNSKLYRIGYSLHQFDLQAGGGTPAAINASKTEIPMPYQCYPAGIQLGPDDKIYVNRCSTFLAVINNPNNLGVSCNFVDTAVVFGSTMTSSGFPSFINGYQYKNNLLECRPTNNTHIKKNEYSLHPNPIRKSAILKFENPDHEEYEFILFDIFGRVVRKTNKISSDQITINRNNLKSGVYFFQLNNYNNIYLKGMLIIE